MKKMFIEIGFKEVWVFKRVNQKYQSAKIINQTNLFVFGFLFKEKLWSFIVKKMFIEIRLCNLTYVFKEHVKFAKIYMVKFNVSILNRLKIMGFS